MLPIASCAEYEVAVLTEMIRVHIDYGASDAAQFEFGVTTRFWGAARYRHVPQAPYELRRRRSIDTHDDHFGLVQAFKPDGVGP